MQTLFVKHHRNSQPRVFLHPLLNRVREFRHFSRAAISARVFTRSRNLTDPVLQCDFCGVGKEHSLLVHDEWLRLSLSCAIFPGAFYLGQFFFKRHPREQVRDTLIKGKLVILVRRNILSGSVKGSGAANKQESSNRKKQRTTRNPVSQVAAS